MCGNNMPSRNLLARKSLGISIINYYIYLVKYIIYRGIPNVESSIWT